MGVSVERVTTRWRLDPPVRCERAYGKEGQPARYVDVDYVDREVWNRDGIVRENWSVRGVPLTSKGNPNGGIDWRFVTEQALADLRRLVLA